MYVPPIHPRATQASPQLRRTVLVVVTLGGAALATATVLARPAPAAPRAELRVGGTFSPPDSLSARLASGDEDTGPGCAESEVARLPGPGH
jgi:hypothetical protein